MLAEKSRISTAVTSVIIPRPYCAAAPDSWRSWATPTLVPRPALTRVAVTIMLAWPRPFSSAPAACTTIRLAASSRSVMSAVPANCIRTGPIRIATLPLYLSSPRSSVSSAPGRHAATWGMLSKNCQTFSTGSATSNSFFISMGLSRHVCVRVLLERLPAAGAAEVVVGALVPHRTGRARRHGHPAHRVLGGYDGRRSDLGTRPGQRAGCPQLDQLGQDGDRYLLVRGGPQVQAGRHPDPVELVLRHAAVREVAEHGGPAPARADKPEVGGPGRGRGLERLLVAVALGGHDDHGAAAGGFRREVGPADEVRPPAEGPGQAGQRPGHRGVAHDDQVRCGQHGLDVDLERSLALAGDGDHGHAVGDPAAELLGGAEQQQPGRAVRHDLLRLADHHRLRDRKSTRLNSS